MPSKDKNVKEHVLNLLESKRGTHISGARIAADLSVSRAAVWKAIEELRREGYAISAITNRGYTLAENSDLLSSQGIAAHLRHRELTDFIATYDTVESTNLTAKQLAVAGAPHGTLVAASTQTAGRGRLGRSFFSPRDTGVYFSIILRPAFIESKSDTPVNPVLITTAASVAVARAIEEISGQSVQIKWVNDLYLDGKKVCGILTEGITNFETGSIESVVIGIGINCFVPEIRFPEELSQRAAALFPTASPKTDYSVPAPRSFSKNALIAASADHIMDIQSELPGSLFMDEYRKRSCVLGKEICFYPGGIPSADPFSCDQSDGAPALNQGIAVEIDDQGALIVQLPDGAYKTLSTGEISIRTIS